jgi:galactonate dehydratase
MKIVDLEGLRIADAGGMLLVVVDTDEGLHGIGEVGMRSRPQAALGAVADYRELLVGRDPTRIDHLWQTLYRGGFYPSTGYLGSVLAAIDVALWDLRGKALGVPLYDLLGGRSRDHVACYTHVPAVEACAALLDEGFRYLRFCPEPAYPPQYEPRAAMRRAIATMHDARAALGDDVELLLDLHTRFDPPEAVTLCREIEPTRPYFVEDPLRCENLSSYRTLRARTGVPLAAGEQLGTKWEFRPLIEGDLVDYVRIDVANTGLTEARKIAAMAEAHHQNTATHNPLGPVTTASSLHLNLSVPNFGVQELANRPHDHDGLFTVLPRYSAGRLYPDGAVAGLGVDIDRDAARHRHALGAAEPPHLRRADGGFTNW